LGYARFGRWCLYVEEALAGRDAALWLAAESLAVEHTGEPLSRYATQGPRRPEGLQQALFAYHEA
jgi:hypothetical protein